MAEQTRSADGVGGAGASAALRGETPGQTRRWLVGFGARRITPQVGVGLSGFAARTQPSAGVHDDLYARAMAIAEPAGEALVLIALDLIGVSAEFTRRLREDVVELARTAPVGPRPKMASQIAVLATHTHGGPASLPEAHLGRVEQATLDGVLTGAVEAALAALEALEPTELTYGTQQVGGMARNRRQGASAVDEELSVLAAWRPAERHPAGALVSYSLHPVVLGADNLLITRDYPGYLLDALEREAPGMLPLFACGCAGDVNHGHRAEASWSTAPAAGRTFAKAEEIGERLAAAAMKAIAAGRAIAPGVAPTTPAGASLGARLTRVQLPLAAREDPAALVARFEAQRATAASAGDHTSAALYTGLLEAARARLAAPAPEALDVELQAFYLGELTLLFLPGEPFVEYGLRLKRAAPGRVLPLAYANAAPGYLPTEGEMTRGGYEVEIAPFFYGAPSSFSCEVEQILLDGVQALLPDAGVAASG